MADRYVVRNMGKCIKLNGSSGYINYTIANGIPVVPAQSFSVCWWGKIDNMAVGQRLFNQGNTSTLNPVYTIAVSDGSNAYKLRLWIRNDTIAQQLLAETNVACIKRGLWQHYCLTDNNGTVKMYINGAEVTAGSWNYTPTGVYTFNTFTFGALVRTSVAGYLAGCFDNIAVYKDRILVASEVKDMCFRDIYPSSGLKLLTKFDENTGTTSTDLSGNGNTANLIGGSSWETNKAPFSGTRTAV